MYDACKDARTAGALIEQLCSLTAPSLRGGGGGGSGTINDPNIDNVVDQVYNQHDTTTTTSTTNSVEETTRQYADRQAMARAARALLSSVTRVLLVADTVVVKQIVASKDRVSTRLKINLKFNFSFFHFYIWKNNFSNVNKKKINIIRFQCH